VQTSCRGNDGSILRDIYYKTYGEYKTEFQGGMDYVFSHCGDTLTIDMIEQKYFNEITNIKPNENHMSFEEIFSYAGLNCAFCFHPEFAAQG
jgi:hypothetical protein